RLIDPGPGRSAIPSTDRLPVAGMQKMLTSVDGCGRPSEPSPAGDPVWVMAWAVGWPKAPAFTWPGQKMPSAAVWVAVPVESGVRLTGSVATKLPDPGMQSSVVRLTLVVVHGCPTWSPSLQTLPMHCGQADGRPRVRKTREARLMLTDDSPVRRS